MTTHVFIVDENTFKYHLEYLFVGTGGKEYNVDFNNRTDSALHYTTENMLVGMMADGCRLRQDDFVLFYVQSSGGKEGKFYGIFKVANDCIFIENNSSQQYLKNILHKNLTFRQCIVPYKVYENGVTEWEALDEIRNTPAPCQMIWSLIYRKLKGNRGNTMVTIYEADKLFDLIRSKNNGTILNGTSFSYNGEKIVNSDNINHYEGNQDIKPNIKTRFISKYNAKLAHEAHLQMLIMQNIGNGTIISLDETLGVNRENIEWLGNEVSCGVGMQRIDIMISQKVDDTQRNIIPIELKAVPASIDNIKQINRYIDWIEQYYNPNRPSTICPVLICKKHKPISNNLKTEFRTFNANGIGRYQPLVYIEYWVDSENNINFSRVQY